MTIQVRRGTAATAATNNPTLAAGEIGFETDTGRFKIGDGVTAWNSLGYAVTADMAGAYTTAEVDSIIAAVADDVDDLADIVATKANADDVVNSVNGMTGSIGNVAMTALGNQWYDTQLFLDGDDNTTGSINALTGVAQFSGGLGSTPLNASNLNSGTVASARLPAASALQSGIIELATSAEVATGTDTVRAVTPSTLASNSASANTASALVRRDGAGDFSAGIVTVTRLRVGTTTSSGTTVPNYASLGGTYGTNTPGHPGNLKVRTYDDGFALYGIGISGNLQEYQAATSAGHRFFVNGGTAALDISSAGTTTLYGPLTKRSYLVAALPTAPPAGTEVYASNARKPGEGSGAGTGRDVVYTNSAWYTGDGLAVTS